MIEHHRQTSDHSRVVRPRSPRDLKGFTLVELLVVIAVMSLLLSILLPAMGRARESARSLKCLSNLRQFAIAAHLYADGQDDHYPIAYDMQTQPIFKSLAWDFTTSKDWSADPPKVTVESGILWQDKTAAEIHQCPSFEGGHNWLADPYTGYNYNTSYIGHGSGEAIVEPARTSDVTRPSRTALFGDGQYSGGANKFMRAPWSNPGDAQFSGRSAGTQGYRHLGRTNVAWCDGHAESWAERHTDTYARDQRNIADDTGFLSPDNSLYDLD
jgi:prepilin-type N-terminal cleavage/methylation domain-containing protein/prepilin-type processing-associated H-X9-DG protein